MVGRDVNVDKKWTMSFHLGGNSMHNVSEMETNITEIVLTVIRYVQTMCVRVDNGRVIGRKMYSEEKKNRKMKLQSKC